MPTGLAPPTPPRPEIGVFGGSGFYSFLEDVEEVELDTPYGQPSAPLMIGEIGGKRVAFLPRHGRQHELPPAQIPVLGDTVPEADETLQVLLSFPSGAFLGKAVGTGTIRNDDLCEYC